MKGFVASMGGGGERVCPASRNETRRQLRIITKVSVRAEHYSIDHKNDKKNNSKSAQKNERQKRQQTSRVELLSRAPPLMSLCMLVDHLEL